MIISSPTVFLYISKKIALWIVLSLLVMVNLGSLIELITSIKITNGSMSDAASITMLQVPNLIVNSMPFSVLTGSVISFFFLNRNSELIVLRSLGISAWQFILPSLMVALCFGTFLILLLSPISAFCQKEYMIYRGKILHKNNNFLEISQSGIWLKVDNPEKKIIYIKDLYNRGKFLSEMIIFDGTNFANITISDLANINGDVLELTNVTIIHPDQKPKKVKSLKFDNFISLEELERSLPHPSTLNVFKIISTANKIQKLGFSITRYKVHFYQQLLQPLLLMALALVGSIIAIIPPRSSKISAPIIISLSAGCVIFFLNKIVLAYSSNDIIHPLTASLVIPAITILCCCAILLSYEDG